MHRRDERQQDRGVALDHRHAIGDAVARDVLLGVPDRVVIELDRDDVRGAELRRGDREHRAAGAEIGDAIARAQDALQEAHDAARRRVLAGAERHSRAR